jgi:hypothetical protein
MYDKLFSLFFGGGPAIGLFSYKPKRGTGVTQKNIFLDVFLVD